MGPCLGKHAEICPKSVAAKIPDLRKIRDRHKLHSDLYFSTWVTKFDAVKGSSRTYTCSEESVKFWWLFDLILWAKMDEEAKWLILVIPLYWRYIVKLQGH